LFNDDKLQYDWQKLDISLCSMTKPMEEIIFHLPTELQNVCLNVELWEVNLLCVIACCGK
jgi:hypothetical protein